MYSKTQAFELIPNGASPMTALITVVAPGNRGALVELVHAKVVLTPGAYTSEYISIDLGQLGTCVLVRLGNAYVAAPGQPIHSVGDSLSSQHTISLRRDGTGIASSEIVSIAFVLRITPQ